MRLAQKVNGRIKSKYARTGEATTVENSLYFGDNLHVLRRYISDESVDLVYLDPPFNSNADYNVVFTASSGRGHRAQIQAFEDTWHWSDEAEEALDEIRAKGGSCAAIVRSLREALGPTDMMAYVVMMAVRLSEMHRVLKSTGSLYLHCDPTASHYLKLVLDSIFGPSNFRSEITWKRSSSHGNVSRGYGALTDRLLFYTKSGDFKWNQQYHKLNDEYIASKFNSTDPDGRRWQSVSLRNPAVRPNLQFEYRASNGISYQPHPNGWAVSEPRLREYDAQGRLHFPRKTDGTLRLKQYLDERPGTRLQNLWDDISAINSQADERLGYPTQKPISLLERIIGTSSDEGDIVLDPFCGCGTAVHAAQKLRRAWIGVDITHVAIHVIADRLSRWMPQTKFSIYGQPRDVAGAQALAELDKYQFQWWATWLAGGQPHGGGKKGADGGIDGTLEFATERGRQDWGIISVKGGKNLGVDMVRQLDAVMRAEGAAIGVLITLGPPTREMERWAVTAGHIELANVRYRRIQLRTIEQLLAGQAIESPFLLTTVQEAPTPSSRGAGRRVPLSPSDTLAQRNMLLPIAGGRAGPRQGALELGDAMHSAPALAVKIGRARKRA